MLNEESQLVKYITSKLNTDKVSLVNIHNGAAVEMFDRQLDRVMQNISDINTDKKARVITLQIAVAPVDDNRSMVAFVINCPPAKLSCQEPVKGFADVRIDPAGKGAYAKIKEDPQLHLPFSNVTPIRKEE